MLSPPLPAEAAPESSQNTRLSALQAEVDELKAAQQRQAPAEPLSFAALLNPDISAAIDYITSYSKEANNWNFTLRNVEIVVQSEVDHLARATIVLNGETELAPTERLDPLEHSHIGVEEAVIETTSLPWGLQLRGGQFFADFTRLGKVHGHDLPFVDRPLSLESGIGGETIARGFELSWLPPIPHYIRLTGGIVDNIGAETPGTGLLHESEEEAEHDGHDHGNAALYKESDRRSLRMLTAYARAATLVELGSNTVLRLGTDYAQSVHNNSRAPMRRIATADAVVQWQPNPARDDQFEAGAEALWTEQRGYVADDILDEAVNGERFRNNPAHTSMAGGYAYAQYRFGKKWTPGVRVDYTRANRYELADEYLQPFQQDIWTYSTYLTLNLSELNRLRFQVNYVNSDRPLGAQRGQNDLQAFFQWTVFLGGHKHGFTP